MRPSVFFSLAGTAIVLAYACSSSGSGSSGATGPAQSPSGGHSATIVASATTVGGIYGSGGNYFFSPTPDTVAVGTSVTFSFGSVTHNVVFAAMANAPADIPASTSTTVARTFTTAGTYNYTCTIHGFSGVMVVQ
jgi:plastocyanin